METQEVECLAQFDNQPMQPPRDGNIGEHVFRDAWLAYTAQDSEGRQAPNYKLGTILMSSGVPLSQRAATVAASVICWLGCRRGVDMLHAAENTDKHRMRRDKVYLSTWSAHNMRDSAVNEGFRTLELLLTPPGERPTTQGVSLQDFEVAERVMLWLGGDIGQKFLAACEAEIQRQQQVEEFKRHLTVNLNLSPTSVEMTLRMAAGYSTKPVQFVQ